MRWFIKYSRQILGTCHRKKKINQVERGKVGCYSVQDGRLVSRASEEVLNKGLKEVRNHVSICEESNFRWNTKCKGPKQKASYPVL